MTSFKLLTEDNVRDRVLTEEEYQRLLFAAPKRLQPIIIMAWETGMRQGEILGLGCKQVDLKADVISLSGEETKTGRKRLAPVSLVVKETFLKPPGMG